MGVGAERSADRQTRADLNHDGNMKSEMLYYANQPLNSQIADR